MKLTHKGIKSLLGAIAFLVFISVNTASANSRFTVKNEGSQKVLVNIFNGDDEVCMAESKHHTVGPGEEQSMGCEGGGKHRCKARVSIDKEQVCLNMDKGCGDNDVLVPNHATLVVPENGTNCSIEE